MSDEELAAQLGISVDELRGMRGSGTLSGLNEYAQAAVDQVRNQAPFRAPLVDTPQPRPIPITPEMVDEVEQAHPALWRRRHVQEARQPGDVTNAPVDVGASVSQTEGLQPTRPVEDTRSADVQPVGPGTYRVVVQTLRGPETIQGDAQAINDRLAQLQAANQVSAGTVHSALSRLGEFRPTPTGRGGAPMGQVSTTIERQIRGQATPEALADAAQASELRQLAQYTVDEANQARFAARGQGLQDIGNLQAQQAQEAQRQAQERQQILTDRFQRFEETMNQVSQMRIDPTQFWGSSGGERFARGLTGALAVALSGLGQAFAGGENQALQVINQAIDRNIAAQRDNMANARAGAQMQGQALQQMRALFQDQQAAEAATRALHLQAAISRVQQLENGANGEYAAALARLRAAMENERMALGTVAAQREVQAVARTQISYRAPQASLPSAAAAALGQPQQAPQRAPGGSLADRRQSRRRRAAGAVTQPARPPAGQPQVPAREVTREQLTEMANAALERGDNQGPPGYRVVSAADFARVNGSPDERRRMRDSVTADNVMRRQYRHLIELRRQYIDTPPWDLDRRNQVAENMRSTRRQVQNQLRIQLGFQSPQAAEQRILDEYVPDPTAGVVHAAHNLLGFDPTLRALEAGFGASVETSGQTLRLFGLAPEAPGPMVQRQQTPTRETEDVRPQDVIGAMDQAGIPTR